MKMQVDDPPYLSVGTAVSAKYKGAFCEAKVSRVARIVKCKVTYKMGLGTATVSDEQIKGTLRVGQLVQAKHPEKKDFVEATIAKIQDCSQYTVVFDDGDITTLRRTALCLKSGRHFNESETLDQLPLTHPEHFGNPVVGGRRGRRNRQLKEDSSDGEIEEENEPDLEGYIVDIGRVVSVESTDKKRNKDSWFPGLVVIPSAQPTVRINIKDEYLIRSFKDGRYYTVPKKEVSEFNKELGDKIESSVLAEAVQKALKYIDSKELPVHWERSSLFDKQHNLDSDFEENLSDSSDDEPSEEKDRFVAQLYKFMDDAGTPLNKSPMVHGKDVDLHRLFRIVQKFGGYNRVTNQNKWKSIAIRLKLYTTQSTFNQVKSVYKKCLLSYEAFYRTLGVTMLNHTRSTKKNKGRSLIRDKDRSTPVNSPKPDREDELVEKKEDDEKSILPEIKKKFDLKKEENKKEISDASSSDGNAEIVETPIVAPPREVGRPKRNPESKLLKEKKIKTPVLDKAKNPELAKKDEQQTRSKTAYEKKKETKQSLGGESSKSQQQPKPIKKEEEKKRGRKKLNPEEKKNPELEQPSTSSSQINIGDKLKVYYGPTHESKVTYEAKVIEIDNDPSGVVYLVHYTGWNTRYDEWIAPNRVAENLSANTKAKRYKQNANLASTSKSQTVKAAVKRNRGMSITGRSTATEIPRSTTPSSVTSSSSRTKSPATPATRSASRLNRLEPGRRTRRASAHTDISNHSESDSEMSEVDDSDSAPRPKDKSEDGAAGSSAVADKPGKRKSAKASTNRARAEKKDDGESPEKEEGDRPKRGRKAKKSSPEKSVPEELSDDDDCAPSNPPPPKGRDFDLNQIRSELKGFAKALKVPTDDKDVLSSSDDSATNVKPQPPTDEIDESKEKQPEQSPATSEDVYEFKEPEPFEFETRKIIDDKSPKKRLVPRLIDDLDKKKTNKSDKDSPEGERKRFKCSPIKKSIESDDGEINNDDDEEEHNDPDDSEKKDEDPFDKLVESPSFNIIKSMDKNLESKQKIMRNILEEPLSLFRELPEAVDDYSRDNMDLSDSESQTQPIFSRENEIFLDPFPDNRNTLDLEFPPKREDDLKMEDDFLTRAIANSSTDEDSNEDSNEDLLLNLPPCKKLADHPESSDAQEESKSASEIEATIKKSPLQSFDANSESDLISAKLQEVQEFTIKTTGTKIADSILQKFNSIKNEEALAGEKRSIDDNPSGQKEMAAGEDLITIDNKMDDNKSDIIGDGKKKRGKVISQAFIDESDSDSSDSEQLVIARSDEDSQTVSLDNKSDVKITENPQEEIENDIEESKSIIEPIKSTEERNFKFDDLKKTDDLNNEKKTIETQQIQNEKEEIKETEEDQPDAHLHSLLLCEETIPRSPASVPEGPSTSELRPKSKSVLEMPFASAPGNSNNANMLLSDEHKAGKAQQPVPQSQQQVALAVPAENRDASAVLDNTPPTTPESTISNLSPRGDDNGGLSPTTADNESCKSNDVELDYPRQRRNSNNKVTPYSEEDTQMNYEPSPLKKSREEAVAVGSCRKRRKSLRGNEDVPVKRGRKPLNRSRHNSDSDDTSEHSISGGTNLAVFDRTSRSPRPSKYNFFVEFDPSLNSGQRIAMLQQKLSELRKTYADVKTELAAVERRRKKIRRREREALKASKQEMACA